MASTSIPHDQQARCRSETWVKPKRVVGRPAAYPYVSLDVHKQVAPEKQGKALPQTSYVYMISATYKDPLHKDHFYIPYSENHLEVCRALMHPCYLYKLHVVIIVNIIIIISSSSSRSSISVITLCHYEYYHY